MAKIRNFYAGSNSSEGFYSIFNEVLNGLEEVYILKGGPGTGKSTIMRKIGIKLMEEGLDLEYLHCSSDNQSIDGVICRELGIGIVDGTAPHIIEPKYPGVRETIINLGQYRNDDLLKQNKQKIITLTDSISKQFEHAYLQFAEAKEIHMNKEKLYIQYMDFKKADDVTNQLIDDLFANVKNGDKNPETRTFFFGAATPRGAVNFIENLTEDTDKRYLIKGRPGSGKSTMLKKIVKKAEELELSVEKYPCGFHPSSLDMVIIPSLKVAILDATAPHEIEPFRLNDIVIDMFKECIDPKVEKTHKEKLEALDVNYKNKMVQGTNYLSEAKRLHDELEEYYKEVMDFEEVNKVRDNVIKHIISLMKEKA